jgi:hypothetical protein
LTVMKAIVTINVTIIISNRVKSRYLRIYHNIAIWQTSYESLLIHTAKELVFGYFLER